MEEVSAASRSVSYVEGAERREVFVQQVDNRNRRNSAGLSADGSGPLPQFDLKSWDSFDPDQTLERLPSLQLPTASTLAPPAPAPALSRPTTPAAAQPLSLLRRDLAPARAFAAPVVSYDDSEPDTDLAATLEIVPEISTSDILEEDAPVRVVAPPARPPLVLPAPVSVPLDLDRLLARARAEASRSPEYFHAPTPAPAPASLLAAPSFNPFEVPAPSAFSPASGRPRTDPTVALPIVLHRRRRRLGWAVGAVAAVLLTAVTVGIGVSKSSAAAGGRSPASVTVTTAAVQAAPVAATPATPAIPAISVQSLPRAPAGTISLAAVAASHRLFVDGRVIESGSATVTCGTHFVQVGSRGQRKYVNVACGQEIVLAN